MEYKHKDLLGSKKFKLTPFERKVYENEKLLQNFMHKGRTVNQDFPEINGLQQTGIIIVF